MTPSPKCPGCGKKKLFIGLNDSIVICANCNKQYMLQQIIESGK